MAHEVCDHCAARMFLSYRDADASYLAPIPPQTAIKVPYWGTEAAIMNSRVPDKISSGGLSSIFGGNSDKRLDIGERDCALSHLEKNDSRRANIDVSSDLGLAEPPRFPNESSRVVGLSYAASPSGQPKSNISRNEKTSEPIQSFVVVGDPLINRRFQGYLWGIICGLGFCGIVFWVDYQDRVDRDRRNRQQHTQDDFGNTKSTQRKAPCPD